MEYEPGDVVPSHFDPPIVTASYFASLCGCYLTIELLHRRGTGVSNLRSWLETLTCSTILGLIGIWCMHFIGNRAIILGSGESHIQLVYAPKFSVLSVFLAIFGLFIAFPAAEYQYKSATNRWIALACTGIFAGLSIVGMHYMGNFGISNYDLNYEPRFLAASIVIAIGDCLTVLVLFYTLREKWISFWWKRAACALFLAGGISAMHFTASTKCIYTLKHYSGDSALHSRNVQVIVAGTLCGLAAFIGFGVLLFTRHRAHVLKRTSQKVMLACAMFTPDGRILVTTEGVLPAREITDKFDPCTFDEDFDKAHPVFQWIFRVTRNWPSVDDFIPGMRGHLHAGSRVAEPRSSTASSRTNQDHESSSNYSMIFRERFCVAAASLAASLHMPLNKIGVLYDEIVETGTLIGEEEFERRRTISPDQRGHDFEMGVMVSVFGKGQLLFLTRQLKDNEIDRLLNAGFKFGTMHQVGRQIAKTLQIPLPTVELLMGGLKHYVDNLWTMQRLGTWLGCFVMIPKLNKKGFDVVVKKQEQDQLPDAQLLGSEPLKWQVDFLERMDAMKVPNCLAFLEDRHRKDTLRTEQEQDFASTVLHACTKLREQLPSLSLENARFYAKPLHAYYSQPAGNRAPATTMFCFVVCTDLHTSIESCDTLTQIPLSFFSVRHQCFNDLPNNDELAQQIHQEFGPLVPRRKAKGSQRARKASLSMSNASNNRPTQSVSRHPSISQLSAGEETHASSDIYEPVDLPQSVSDLTTNTTTPPTEHSNALGGILYSREFAANSNEIGCGDGDSGIEMGNNVAVGPSKPQLTFVDELVTFTRSMIPTRLGY